MKSKDLNEDDLDDDLKDADAEDAKHQVLYSALIICHVIDIQYVNVYK